MFQFDGSWIVFTLLNQNLKTMANPNVKLAEQILGKLKGANLLDDNIDEAAFKQKLETGKLTNSDWASFLLNTENPSTNETAETGN